MGIGCEKRLLCIRGCTSGACAGQQGSYCICVSAEQGVRVIHASIRLKCSRCLRLHTRAVHTGRGSRTTSAPHQA
ncbi:hypothetical protein CALCODRAFT_179306 [Calocera cornea HHB12733]|uniref:Uncharacterized protein n=1 Tax=Calocera cornea HHB12733 TaxID=1353952 RepID=A0A165CDA3_9BASI|nr:hypothetical protein CALCODRAFT_179306 [Calocera cornea HHB12733]